MTSLSTMNDTAVHRAPGAAVRRFGFSSHTTRCIDGLNGRMRRHKDPYLGVIADEMEHILKIMLARYKAVEALREARFFLLGRTGTIGIVGVIDSALQIADPDYATFQNLDSGGEK